MDLRQMLGISKPFGDYKIIPMMVAEVVEAQYADELAILSMNPNFALTKPEYKAVFDKWIQRKIKTSDGKDVTLETLNVSTPFLSAMMTELFNDSGFPVAPNQKA